MDEAPAVIPQDLSEDRFLAYYAEASLSQDTWGRSRRIHSLMMRALQRLGLPASELAVGDVGCGAGTQSRVWSEAGHRVSGVDIDEGLISLARERLRESPSKVPIEFAVGSADALPFGDASLDICLMPELLEHVVDWQACLDECARVLKPGGLLFLSTTNALCPRQQEFKLPLYSWYPAAVKRRCERLAVSSRPQWVNHAQYPAVNWFTFYGLRRELTARGFAQCFDRFDNMGTEHLGAMARAGVRVARRFRAVRLLGHVVTPYTQIVAIKG
ncbi:MAG: class I SAM-dependent methyltransferase [Pseudomonadota bacterium]